MARNKFEQDEADVLNIYAKVNGQGLGGAPPGSVVTGGMASATGADLITGGASYGGNLLFIITFLIFSIGIQ